MTPALEEIRKSGAPHATWVGSLVAVILGDSDSMNVLSAGRWVCSVASPRISSDSMDLR